MAFSKTAPRMVPITLPVTLPIALVSVAMALSVMLATTHAHAGPEDIPVPTGAEPPPPPPPPATPTATTTATTTTSETTTASESSESSAANAPRFHFEGEFLYAAFYNQSFDGDGGGYHVASSHGHGAMLGGAAAFSLRLTKTFHIGLAARYYTIGIDDATSSVLAVPVTFAFVLPVARKSSLSLGGGVGWATVNITPAPVEVDFNHKGGPYGEARIAFLQRLFPAVEGMLSSTLWFAPGSQDGPSYGLMLGIGVRLGG